MKHNISSVDLSWVTDSQCAKIIENYKAKEGAVEKDELIRSFKEDCLEAQNYAASTMNIGRMIELCKFRCKNSDQRNALWNKIKNSISAVSIEQFTDLVSFQCFDEIDKNIVWNLCKDKLDELNYTQFIALINYNFFDADQRNVIWNAIEKRLDILLEDVEKFSEMYKHHYFSDIQRETILVSVKNKFCEWCKQDPTLEKKILDWDQLTEAHRDLIAKEIHKNTTEALGTSSVEKNSSTVASLVGNQHTLIYSQKPTPHEQKKENPLTPRPFK